MFISSTLPFAPTWASTRLAAVSPPTNEMTVLPLLVDPPGRTRMVPPLLGVTAVTVSHTDDTFCAGTPPWPSTGNDTQVLAATGPGTPPVPFRVSSSRAGAGTPTDPGAEASGAGGGIGPVAAPAGWPP